MENNTDKRLLEAKRTKYVRLLERLLFNTISYLNKSDEPNKKDFDSRVNNHKKRLEGFEDVTLYSSELSALETLVKQIIDFSNSQENIEEIKNKLLYEMNQYEKSKRHRGYKKEKHKHAYKKEWDH
jgi:hypothetical protein